jgi:type II secretory pathway component PulK
MNGHRPHNFFARSADPRRRGVILVIAMTVSFTMAMVVLVLCRTMAVEALASANEAALIQADAIERGAEQYAIGLLSVNQAGVMALTDDYFAGIQVGDGYFWILRPTYDDPWLPMFGFVDECAKLDLNYATIDQLYMLPGMTDEAAPAIIDWRGTGSQPGGAKDDYYLSLADPYYCKQSPYETVEELLLVRGVPREMLYGDGTAPPLGQQSVMGSSNRPLFSDPTLSRGLFDLFTVHAYSPRTGGGGGNNQPNRGRVNVNTAPREVLMTLIPFGVSETDIDTLVSYRSANVDPSAGDTSWVNAAIGNRGNNFNNRICGQSLRYSADILAVSGNGRAFKRVRIVIDSTQTPPAIVYRRDMTDRGWPMDQEILTSLRNSTWAGQTGSSMMGGALR